MSWGVSNAPLNPDELAQLRRFAAIPLPEKIRWLEEMHQLALRWGAQRAQ